jgi:hypothetical protein
MTTQTPTFTAYLTDTGNRDMGKEIAFPKSTTFEEILQQAIKHQAQIIVRTSYVSDNRSGQWYIKALGNSRDHKTLKKKLEDNRASKKHLKRKTWLIKYQDTA